MYDTLCLQGIHQSSTTTKISEFSRNVGNGKDNKNYNDASQTP